MKLDYKRIANYIIAIFVLYSLVMFILEKRMNRNIAKYEVSCKVIDKTTAGTRTKRVHVEYFNKMYSIDSDYLYNTTNVGQKIKLLFFPPLEIFMIPNEKNYFDLFWISFLIACILKGLIYLKSEF